MKTLALALLLLSALNKPAPAQIDPIRLWQGFSWDPRIAAPKQAGLNVTPTDGTSFTGRLFLNQTWRTIVGRNASDGSVDIVEIGTPRPLHLLGTVIANGDGTYRMRLNFNADDSSPQVVELLGLLPPGPCRPAASYSGRFTRTTGATGPVTLAFDTPTGDASFVSGKLTQDSQTYSFVATISPRQNADGSYNLALIGVAPTGSTRGATMQDFCLIGLLLPAGPMNQSRLTGAYERSLFFSTRVVPLNQGTLDAIGP